MVARRVQGGAPGSIRTTHPSTYWSACVWRLSACNWRLKPSLTCGRISSKWQRLGPSWRKGSPASYLLSFRRGLSDTGCLTGPGARYWLRSRRWIRSRAVYHACSKVTSGRRDFMVFVAHRSSFSSHPFWCACGTFPSEVYTESAAIRSLLLGCKRAAALN